VKSYIKFDSKAELKAFLQLQDCSTEHLTLITHQPVFFAGVRWSLDFKLIANSPTGACILDDFCTKINTHLDVDTEAIESAFIEYKGIQDTNFLHKQKKLLQYPEKDKRVILMSDNPQAFCHELDYFYCKPIPSVSYTVKCLKTSIGENK
jgi:hypothetical protein